LNETYNASPLRIRDKKNDLFTAHVKSFKQLEIPVRTFKKYIANNQRAQVFQPKTREAGGGVAIMLPPTSA
jgi:hypothetical protein